MSRGMRDPEGSGIRAWLQGAWQRTERVEVVRRDSGGNPGGVVLSSVDGPDHLGRIRELTSEGGFTDDICRHSSEYLIVLRDIRGVVIGRGGLHEGSRIAWNPDEYQSDLVLSHPVELAHLLMGMDIPGQSKTLLPFMFHAFDLHELDGRIRHDAAPDTRPSWIPTDLWQSATSTPTTALGALTGITSLSGDRDTGAFDSADSGQVDLLLSWLGHTPWPAEAMSGDGVLVRDALSNIGEKRVVEHLGATSDVRCHVGAAIWSAFLEDDRRILQSLGGDFWERLGSRSQGVLG